MLSQGCDASVLASLRRSLAAALAAFCSWGVGFLPPSLPGPRSGNSPTPLHCTGGHCDAAERWGGTVSGPESRRAASGHPSRGGSSRVLLRRRLSFCISSQVGTVFPAGLAGGSFHLSSFFFLSSSSCPQGFSHPGPSAGLQGGHCSGQWGARALFPPGERALGMVTRSSTPSVRQ